MSDKAVADAVWEILSRDPAIAELFTVRTPSYRYFEHRSVRYCWNAEPVADKAGKWFAWEYRPVGPGARSGKAQRWELRHRVRAGSRKAAKARALHWYLQAKGEG